VADPLERDEPRARDLTGQRLGVAVGEQRVFGAVEHQGRSADLAETVPRRLAPVEDSVVLHARLDVDRPIEDPAGERSHVHLVERERSGEGAQALHHVVDHGLPV
jgi:hypothetical protein